MKGIIDHCSIMVYYTTVIQKYNVIQYAGSNLLPNFLPLIPFYLTFENQEDAITGLSFIETSFHTSFIKSQSQYFCQANLSDKLYC